MAMVAIPRDGCMLEDVPAAAVDGQSWLVEFALASGHGVLGGEHRVPRHMELPCGEPPHVTEQWIGMGGAAVAPTCHVLASSRWQSRGA